MSVASDVAHGFGFDYIVFIDTDTCCPYLGSNSTNVAYYDKEGVKFGKPNENCSIYVPTYSIIGTGENEGECKGKFVNKFLQKATGLIFPLSNSKVKKKRLYLRTEDDGVFVKIKDSYLYWEELAMVIEFYDPIKER